MRESEAEKYSHMTSDELVKSLRAFEEQNDRDPGGDPVLGKLIGDVRRLLREKFGIDK